MAEAAVFYLGEENFARGLQSHSKLLFDTTPSVAVLVLWLCQNVPQWVKEMLAVETRLCLLWALPGTWPSHRVPAQLFGVGRVGAGVGGGDVY